MFFANNDNFEFALVWCNFGNFTFCVLFSGLKFLSVLFLMLFSCLDFKSLLLRCIRVLVKREVMPCSGKYTIVLARRKTLHSSSVSIFFFLLFLTLAGQKRPILLWASAYISWLPISAKRIVTSIWHHLLYPGLPELKFKVRSRHTRSLFWSLLTYISFFCCVYNSSRVRINNLARFVSRISFTSRRNLNRRFFSFHIKK